MTKAYGIVSRSIGSFEPNASEAAASALHKDGVIVLDQLWSCDRIAELHAGLQAHYAHYINVGETLPEDNLLVSNRRFISPITIAPPFDCFDVILHPALVDLFKTALGGDFVIEAFGVIIALPGARDQKRHHDCPLLFPETGIDRLLPPSSLTISCPLISQVADTGMTAFWPGSHRRLGGEVSETDCMQAEVLAGSCAVWDMRTLHCGLANQGNVARPLLYMTVCRPFWIDHVNFHQGRNAKLLADEVTLRNLPMEHQKRFVRAICRDKPFIPSEEDVPSQRSVSSP